MHNIMLPNFKESIMTLELFLVLAVVVFVLGLVVGFLWKQGG